MRKAFTAATLTCLFSLPVQADLSVNAHAATIGLGAELSYRFDQPFAVRGGWQRLDIDPDIEAEDQNGIEGDELSYNGDLELNNGNVFVDWVPGNQRFRFTVGAVLNNSEVEVVSRCNNAASGPGPIIPGTPPVSGGCEVGGGRFAPSDIGEAHTSIDFEPVAPYIGLGWSHAPGARWSWTADIGVAYLGEADAEITSTGSCNSSSACRDQLQQEEEELERELEDFEWFPMLSLGVSYRF